MSEPDISLGDVAVSYPIPNTWTTAPLSRIAKLAFGQSPPSSTYNVSGAGLPFFQGKAEFGERYPTVEKWCTAPSRVAEAGDILLSIRAPVGPTNIAPCKCGIGRGLASIRPHDAIPTNYVLYYLRHIAARLATKGTGTTFGAITKPVVEGIEIPLAPEAALPRIVSKIEQLSSRIEEGERALERVQKLVVRYRQSVLKAAVTGELTRDWREKNKGNHESGEALLARILNARSEAWEKAEQEKMRAKGVTPANDKWKQKFEEPTSPAAEALTQLPDGWTWASMEQVGEIRLGRQRAPQHHTGDHMRPYLRVANVYEDRLDLTDVKEMNFTPQEFETYQLRAGDILLNEGQSPELVGRPAMYRGEIPGCCYQKTLLRFRAHEGISRDFALFVFRSYLHSGRFRRSANITTSIAHLAAERFVRIEFPVPSEAEQAEIVEQATRKLSVVSHLERDLRERRKAVDGLRQSVLKAAFAGQLLPQAPTDETASDFLKRIVSARATASQTYPKRGRNKTGQTE